MNYVDLNNKKLLQKIFLCSIFIQEEIPYDQKKISPYNKFHFRNTAMAYNILPCYGRPSP